MAGRGFVFTIIASMAIAILSAMALLYAGLQQQRATDAIAGGAYRAFDQPVQESYVPYQDVMRLFSLNYYRNATTYFFIESQWATKKADTNSSLEAYNRLLAIYSNYTQSNASISVADFELTGNATLGSANMQYSTSMSAKAVLANSTSAFTSIDLNYSTTYGVSSASYSTKPNATGTIPFRLRSTSYDSATDTNLNCSTSCSITAGITYTVTLAYNLPNITINLTINSTSVLTAYGSYLIDSGHNVTHNITLGTGATYDLVFRGTQYSGNTNATVNPGFIEPAYPAGTAATKHYGNVTAANLTYNAVAIDFNNDTVYDSLYLDTSANFTDGNQIELLQNNSYAFLNNRVFLILIAPDGNSILLEDVPGYRMTKGRLSLARGF